MRSGLYRILSAAALLLLIAGCSKPAAIVNGEKISKKEFNKALDNRMKVMVRMGISADKASLANTVMHELISDKLLMQEVKSRKLDVPDVDVEAAVRNMEVISGGKDKLEANLKQNGISKESFRKEVKKDLLIQKLEETLLPDSAVTDEEVRNIYDTQPQMSVTPERVNMRFIETSSEDRANAIAADMKKEKLGFDQEAAKLAGDKDVRVSEYGWTELVLGPVIDKALNELKPGETGGPYKGGQDYYMLTVKGKEPARKLKFEEAKDKIKQLALEQKRQAALMNLLGEKMKEARIQTF